MAKKINPELLRVFAAWARSKGHVRPSTNEGMAALLETFKAELVGRADQQAEYVLRQFGEDPPMIASADPALDLLRDSGDMIDIAERERDEGSDFTEIVHERNASMEEAGGDDLAAEVIYRDKMVVHAEEDAPSASDAPPSWKKTIFGATVNVQPNVNTAQQGPMIQVVNWPGEPRECRPVTVTVAPVPAQISAAGGLRIPGAAVSRPVALVQWGTEQGYFEALVDLGSGMMFTVSCCSCTVSIGLDAGSTSPMQVYGSMSFGSATHPVPAVRTGYADGLAVGTPQLLYRPMFAMSIVAIDRSDYTQPITLTYMDLAGNAIGHHIFAANTSLDAPLYLPNDAISVLMTNSGAATVNARLTFGLTF